MATVPEPLVAEPVVQPAGVTDGEEATRLTRVAGRVIPLTLAVQLSSFAASVAVASVLGATRKTDAYFLAFAVPMFVYAMLVGTLRLSAIPALTEVDVNKRDLDRASGELIGAVLAISGALAVVATGISLAAVPALGGGHHVDLPLTRLLLLELTPLTVVGATVGALHAIVSVRRRFIAPVVALGFDPALRTVLVIATGHAIGVQALVIGNLAGGALAIAMLWRVAGAAGIRVRPRFGVKSAFLRSTFAVSVPVLIANTVLLANPLVDRAMATSLGEGSVTVLNNALQISNVPVILLGSTLAAPVVATWGRRYAESGWAALRSSARNALVAGLVVIPPIAILGFVLRHDVITAVYQGGAYSSHDVDRTAATFGAFLLGIPAQLLLQVYAYVFLVRRDVLIPMYIAISNVFMNIALNFVFRALFGVAGIALSTTVTLTVLFVVYVVAARRRYGPLELPDLVATIARIAVAGSLAGAAALALVGVLPSAHTRPSGVEVTCVVATVGALVYTTGMLALSTRYRSSALELVHRWRASRAPSASG
jgi:putative peptidoglycan lipid II flippase